MVPAPIHTSAPFMSHETVHFLKKEIFGYEPFFGTEIGTDERMEIQFGFALFP